MSSEVFNIWSGGQPTLRGMKLDIRHDHKWSTTVNTSAANIESRYSYQPAPRRRWEVDYEFVDSTDGSYLLNFFNSRHGRLDNFYFVDPWTGASVLVRFDHDDLSLHHLGVVGRAGEFPYKWTCSIAVLEVLGEAP